MPEPGPGPSRGRKLFCRLRSGTGPPILGGPVCETRARSVASPMSPGTSVTDWLGRLRAGDRDAAQRLWERYFDQLVRLARGRLRGARRRAADEEDVALSALDSF